MLRRQGRAGVEGAEEGGERWIQDPISSPTHRFACFQCSLPSLGPPRAHLGALVSVKKKSMRMKNRGKENKSGRKRENRDRAPTKIEKAAREA